MGAIRSLDMSDVSARNHMYDLVQKNPDTEVAFALGGVVRWTTAILKDVFEYEGASKQEWQVSFDSRVAQKTHQKIISQNHTVIGVWHDHLEDKWHAHDFSGQDKESIAQQDEDLHLLAYKTQEWSVQLKLVDTAMRPVPVYVHGVRMDIAEVFNDGKVSEYKQAA